MGATLNVVVAAAATIFFVYFHLKWKIGSGKGEKRINIFSLLAAEHMQNDFCPAVQSLF
jgi:hypothetical protein